MNRLVHVSQYCLQRLEAALQGFRQEPLPIPGFTLGPSACKGDTSNLPQGHRVGAKSQPRETHLPWSPRTQVSPEMLASAPGGNKLSFQCQQLTFKANHTS